MPSKTFHNLKCEKKENLIRFAMTEFSNNLYPKVSINKIIQNAGISRGSFYMYFEDKEDLFLYLIQLHTKKLNQIVKESLILNKGNLSKTFLEIYDRIIEKLKKFQYIGFFKNVFMFFNLNKERFSNPFHTLYIEVENLICFEKIRVTDKEFVFHMLMQNLFSTLAIAAQEKKDQRFRKIYEKRMDILCYGIYQKEEDLC